MFYNKIFSIKSLLEAGVHYGHKTNRWDPRMAPYIYGIKNGVHIIDLEQTAPMLDRALFAIKSVAAKNGKILFLSTKQNSLDIVAEQAKRCGQFYVNKRWLGGMLSNWSTVSASVDRMYDYETLLAGDNSLLKKKEKLVLQRRSDKLDSVLGGIKTMGTTPDLLFVIDAQKHRGAIKEANSMGIEVCAVVDTNSDPTGIDYLIPGNDDARKAITLYMSLAADAAIAGTYEALAAANITEIDETMDINALKELTVKKQQTFHKKPGSNFSKLRSNKKSPKAKV
jgi:small subunit ribosomal protein S2